MTRRTSKDVGLWITDTTTETLGDVFIDKSAEFRGFPGTGREWITEEVIPFGETEAENRDVGVARIPDVQLEVDMDETAGTAYRILANAANSRAVLTFKVVIGTRTKKYDFFVSNDNDTTAGGQTNRGMFTIKYAGNYSDAFA